MAIQGFNAKVLKILLGKQFLSNEQYDDATKLAEQKGENVPIDELLISNEFIDEEAYVSAIASSVGIPPVNLDRIKPNAELRDEISQDLVDHHNIFPISKLGDILTVAIANPFDVINHDDFKVIVGYKLRKVISTVPAIKRAIENFYHAADQELANFLNEFEDEEGSIEESDKKNDDDLATADVHGSEIVDIVNKILINSVRNMCSDIHFEPLEERIRVRVRTDGILSEMSTIPKRYLNNIISRLKVMTSEMDISQRMLPQDGSFRVVIEGRNIDFRVSSLPTVRGEKIALRILDKGILKYTLEELGFGQVILDSIDWAIHQPYGMILCNGPTGCGKTTTLYTCIKAIDDITENITTVEEPVEYEIYGINQVNVQAEQGRSFPAALRSILRQDPDTILIGEIRDHETIDIAVKAALTGHRVFSTLHTSDAASTITRILGLGVEPFLVGSSLLCVVSQRLPRRLCENCKEEMPQRPSHESLIHFGFTEEEAEDTSYILFKAVGCEKCSSGGYKGRFAIAECIRIDEDISKMIMENCSSIEIKRAAIERGMQTLRESGIAAIKRGICTFEEVKKVSGID